MKIVLKKKAEANQPIYAHLQPVVDFLIDRGAIPAGNPIWKNSPDGWNCVLRVQYSLLKEVEKNFTFPDAIKIGKKGDSILCFATRSRVMLCPVRTVRTKD